MVEDLLHVVGQGARRDQAIVREPRSSSRTRRPRRRPPSRSRRREPRPSPRGARGRRGRGPSAGPRGRRRAAARRGRRSRTGAPRRGPSGPGCTSPRPGTRPGGLPRPPPSLRRSAERWTGHGSAEGASTSAAAISAIGIAFVWVVIGTPPHVSRSKPRATGPTDQRLRVNREAHGRCANEPSPCRGAVRRGRRGTRPDGRARQPRDRTLCDRGRTDDICGPTHQLPALTRGSRTFRKGTPCSCSTGSSSASTSLLIGWVAWWYGRHQKDSEDYFLAGRNAGWIVIGASIFTSNIGSEHIVGLAGQGATTGMAMAHWELHAWVLIMLAGLFVPFYYKSGVETIPQFLEKRFSARARWILSCVSLVAYVFTKVSVTVYAGAIVFQALLPGHLRLARERLLGRRVHHGDHHRHLHRLRRHARHHEHGHAAGGDHPVRLLRHHRHRPRRSWAAGASW